MAHFTVYSTEAPAPAGPFGTEGTKSPAIKAKEEIVLEPIQTDFAEYVSGSAFSEKEGKLEVQFSFDYPRHYETAAKALEGSHWFLGESITVKEGETKTFNLFALAPYCRLVWTQGEAEVKKVRIYARTQEKGRI